MKASKRDALTGLGIVVPVVIYYALFSLVPVGLLIWYSFRDYNVILNKNNFVGLQNYLTVFTNPVYFRSIGITLFVAVFITGIGMALGYMLARLLLRVKKGRGILRILWYIPVLLPLAVMSRWVEMLLRPQGTLNNLVTLLGGNPIDWYQSKFWMYFFIIALVTWKGVGGTALYFMAGMAGIDNELYEAADLDGATGLKRVFYVTLPLMRPMLGYILITGFIGAFGLFEPVQLISQGGPDQSTKVIFYMIYDEAIRNNKLGFSCALSVIVFIILLLLTMLNAYITDDSMLKE